MVTLEHQPTPELSSVMASHSAVLWLTHAGKASKHQAWPPDTAQQMGHGQDNPQTVLVGYVQYHTFTVMVFFCSTTGGHQTDNCSLCIVNMRWPANLSSPAVISCGDPGPIANGIYQGSEFTYNHTVTYHCNPGHLMEPPEHSTLRCTKEGTWNQTKPSCKGKRSCYQSNYWIKTAAFEFI